MLDLLHKRVGHRGSVVLLLVAAVFWSLGGLLIKSVHWNAMAVSGMRSIIGAAVIGLVVRRLRFTWSFEQIGGALAYAGTVTLFVASNKLTTAANAILLQYTAPVHVAIFGHWFLGEKTSRKDWLTIGAVLAGMVLFFLDDLSAAGFLGNLFGLLSGVCFAWLTLFLRRQKDESGIESVFLGNVLAGAIGIPFMFIGTGPDLAGWVSLALLGVVQLGIPYIVFTVALRHVTAIEAILVPMIEPIMNPLWVALVIGEYPGALSFVGGCIVIGSLSARHLPALVGKGWRRIRPDDPGRLSHP